MSENKLSDNDVEENWLFTWLIVGLVGLLGYIYYQATGGTDLPVAPSVNPVHSEKGEPTAHLSAPISLFDGQSMGDWEAIEFGGEGDISVEHGVMAFEMGDPLTGVSLAKEDLPTNNYQVSLSARKMDGVDFMCGLTFPVDESYCTLVLGGWGGDVCGLSCIDDKDASSNDTTASMIFEKERWYKIKVRVVPNHIKAWVDDKLLVDADIEGKKISLRGDVSLCEPLGICCFQTRTEYKDIELRKIESH